jgi:Uma2 family endonuclease
MQLLTKKFTIEQYHQMGEAHIFYPEERLELIKGIIIKKSSIDLENIPQLELDSSEELVKLLTRKFTVKEYQKMGESNIFHPEERLELIKGEMVIMSPIGAKHASMVNRLTNLLCRKLPEEIIVSVQNSIVLDDYTEPQPDLVMAKFREDFYKNQPIKPENIYWLIEVSDSTIKYDRTTKIPLYAENKIDEVWIVNLNNSTLEVYRQPENNSYQNVQKLTSNQTISPLDFPDLIINLSTIFN